MNVTTWGELTSEWIGRSVIVRWEDASLPMAEGFPSGVPHEWRGMIVRDDPVKPSAFWLEREAAFTGGFPAHALVQEVPQ